jgi:hypothetical protein
MLAEVCTHLGDPECAADMERLLRPFADRVVTSPHAIFGGPLARFLGLVAVCRGDVEAASADLERARAIARGMNARLVLETLDRDEERLGAVAPAPASAPAPAPAVLRREGDVWLLRYEGRMVRLRDGKGIRYLAALLASPGDEIHALDLVRLETRTTGSVLAAGDAGPVLDAEAKTAYRRRVAELREELEEAERFNDPERAAALREEMEVIASELSAAVGLGGRDRRAASEAERARINVTRAIRSTLKRISDHDEPLGLELTATVRTGNFCAHEPDARHPVRWKVEQS